MLNTTALNYRTFLVVGAIAVGIVLSLAGCAILPGAPGSRPENIVIIHVDDLGWRDLGCMGSPVYETPHIDRLARGGTLYTSAYAAASLCTPSRACMLTGSQPSRHGVYTVVKNRGKKEGWKVVPEKNSHYLAEDYPTIGTVLTDAGIANGTVGKWHIGVRVPSHGFDEGKWGGYLGMPINYFAPYKLGFLPKDAPDGAYLPEYVRAAGVDFLERHKREPFFLYFSTYLPHDEIKNDDGSTLTAPDAVVRKYERKIEAMAKSGADLQGHDNAIYAAMIEETDRSVGAIVDKLKALGLLEKTLVLFISDNGGHHRYTSNQPLRGAKGNMYEGGIRVPMIASMPGRIAAGAICDEPVSGLDFYPTICSFMGLEPTDPSKVDGKNLTDLIFAGQPLGERNLFWTYPSYGSKTAPHMVMRRGDWKIHYNFEKNTYELYNLKDDIGETQNLVGSRPQIFEKMRTHLHACCDRFGAPKVLAPNSDYDETQAHAARDESRAEARPPPLSTARAYRQIGLNTTGE